MLASHSIELSLKAHLMTRGRTVLELGRKPFGHDLKVLLEAAVADGLGVDGYGEFVGSVVEAASNAHSVTFGHRYFQHGTMEVAEIDALIAVAGLLLARLHVPCLRDLFGDDVYAAIGPRLSEWPTMEEAVDLIAQLPKDCCSIADVCPCIVARLNRLYAET